MDFSWSFHLVYLFIKSLKPISRGSLLFVYDTRDVNGGLMTDLSQRFDVTSHPLVLSQVIRVTKLFCLNPSDSVNLIVTVYSPSFHDLGLSSFLNVSSQKTGSRLHMSPLIHPSLKDSTLS